MISGRFAGPLTALALVAAACGGSSSPTAEAEGVSPTTSPTPTTAETTTAAPTTAVPSTTTTTTAAAPVAVDDAMGFDQLGEFGVGRREVQLVDTARERTLSVDIVYPTAAGATGEPSIYQFIPTIELASSVAIADASPAAGSFPIVVYSHGAGGTRWITTHLTEHLASHGFVVIAADHAGDTLLESIGDSRLPFEELAVLRPQDVDFLIESAASPTGVDAFDEVTAIADA
ncbi:MAG: alpha/beta hydrolase family protein [Acidimicrobiales bacterium]